MKIKLVDIVLGLVVVGVVAVMAGGAIRELRVRLANPVWAETEGVMLASSLEKKRNKYNADDYTLNVEYTYQVAGETFTSTRLSFAGGVEIDGPSAEMEALRSSTFAVGQTVTVYYAPTQPRYSALFAHSTVGRLLGMIAMSFAILGLFGCYFLYRLFRG